MFSPWHYVIIVNERKIVKRQHTYNCAVNLTYTMRIYTIHTVRSTYCYFLSLQDFLRRPRCSILVYNLQKQPVKAGRAVKDDSFLQLYLLLGPQCVALHCRMTPIKYVLKSTSFPVWSITTLLSAVSTVSASCKQAMTQRVGGVRQMFPSWAPWFQSLFLIIIPCFFLPGKTMFTSTFFTNSSNNRMWTRKLTFNWKSEWFRKFLEPFVPVVKSGVHGQQKSQTLGRWNPLPGLNTSFIPAFSYPLPTLIAALTFSQSVTHLYSRVNPQTQYYPGASYNFGLFPCRDLRTALGTPAILSSGCVWMDI